MVSLLDQSSDKEIKPWALAWAKFKFNFTVLKMLISNINPLPPPPSHYVPRLLQSDRPLLTDMICSHFSSYRQPYSSPPAAWSLTWLIMAYPKVAGVSLFSSASFPCCTPSLCLFCLWKRCQEPIPAGTGILWYVRQQIIMIQKLIGKYKKKKLLNNAIL